jgi:hypothetical protein
VPRADAGPVSIFAPKRACCTNVHIFDICVNSLDVFNHLKSLQNITVDSDCIVLHQKIKASSPGSLRPER